MAEITVALIKQLRDKTGAGISKCKKALGEVDGDVNAAIDWLRKQDVKTSVATRETSEGLIKAKVAGKKAALIELQCETDFAARNEMFIELVDKLLDAGFAAGAATDEALNAVEIDGQVAEQVIKTSINTIGENVRLTRFVTRTLDGEGLIGQYVHTNGKVGVLLGIQTGKAETADNEAVETLGKHLCMHIAGAPIPPLAITRDELDQDMIEKEKATLLEIMNNDPKDSKKPDNIKEKIIGGKMNRFFSERVLPEQKFVMDDKKSIKEVVEGVAKEVGDSLSLAWFERWEIGA